METPNVIFARMLDTGTSSVILRRLTRLLNAFNDNVPQFCAATKTQLLATYNKMTPGKKRGLSKATFQGFDEFVRLWKTSDYDRRRLAEETVRVAEERKALEESAKADALKETVDLKVMADAVAWWQSAFAECTLGDLMDSYRRLVTKGAK